MSAIGQRWCVAAALVAAALLVAGCASDPAAPRSASPGASTSTQQQRDAAAVARTVQAYLDEWAAHGPARASRYLVPGQRVGRDAGMPRLESGRVTAFELRRAKPLMIEVSMVLRFDGDTLAWDRGPNERFVTAVPDQTGGYLLEFATSP